MGVSVDLETCDSCGVCVDICPEDVLAEGIGSIEVAREEECWYCGCCMMDCPIDAIKVEYPLYMEPVIVRSGDKSAQRMGTEEW